MTWHPCVHPSVNLALLAWGQIIKKRSIEDLTPEGRYRFSTRSEPTFR
jgi:hypothetical protein